MSNRPQARHGLQWFVAIFCWFIGFIAFLALLGGHRDNKLYMLIFFIVFGGGGTVAYGYINNNGSADFDWRPDP